MSRPRRVLLVLGRSSGGIARHVAQVAEGLRGDELLRIDVAGPPDLPVHMPDPILPLVIPDGALRGHPSAISRIRGLLNEDGYDVIHAHGLRAALDGGIGAARTRARSLATIHNLVRADISGASRAGLFRRAEPLAVCLNRHVFAPSRDIASHLRSVAPRCAGRVETLHLGVGAKPTIVCARATVRRELGLADEQRLVVTVARLAPQKALHVLLDAIALLDERYVLAMVGDGPLEQELRARAVRLGIDDRVRWLGYRGGVADQVSAADAFCLSSTWEACSLAAQEAIALGTVVVSTDVGGMKELIEDKVSGRLVPRGDHRGLARAITDVVESPAVARAYAARALHDLEREFSVAAMLERLREVYLQGTR